MLQLQSFYEGHRGAVLSLAGNAEDKYFYSSGAEGLIVRWQRDVPNEGQVLLKLSGYISSLVYDIIEKRIYTAVNHKGIYIINAESGLLINTIDIPATSFGSLHIAPDFMIVTTKIGEIILLDRSSYKIVKRIATGLNEFPKIAVGSDHFWYSDIDNVKYVDSRNINKSVISLKVNSVKSMGLTDKSLVILTDKGLTNWNLNNLKKEQELNEPGVRDFESVYVKPNSSIIYTLSTSNHIFEYQVTKKGFRFINKSQIEHNGKINDLLWIENYKFVISAGTDKKIGVWQFN